MKVRFNAQKAQKSECREEKMLQLIEEIVMPPIYLIC